MMNIKKITKEIYESIFNEDVGDEYLKRKYNIKGEFDDFEDKYKSHSAKYEIIDEEGDWKLYKNPKSLEYIGNDARGVILPSGDLYIESVSGKKIHNDILKILHNKGILSYPPKKNWGRKTPKESGFLTVQRYKSSPYIAIGESNRVLYDEDNYKENIDDYDFFMDKARRMNPNINFIDKLVGTKSPNKKTGTNLMDESYL